MTEENTINEEVSLTEGEAENENLTAPAEQGELCEDAQEENSSDAEMNESEQNEQEIAGSDISAEDFAKTLQNPMFAVFARGRSGDITSAVRDFAAMMEAGKGMLSEDERMKLTPSAGFSGGAGVALSERQRKMAREAGMSYREYYEFIRTLPEKTNR